MSLVFILAECRDRDERKRASLELSRFVIVNLNLLQSEGVQANQKCLIPSKGPTRNQIPLAVSSNQRNYFHTPCSFVFQAAGGPRRDSSSCTFPGRVTERGCSAAPACQNVLIFDRRSLRNILDRSAKESKDSVRRGPPSGVGMFVAGISARPQVRFLKAIAFPKRCSCVFQAAGDPRHRIPKECPFSGGVINVSAATMPRLFGGPRLSECSDF